MRRRRVRYNAGRRQADRGQVLNREAGQSVPTQKWRVLVTKLGVDNVLYEGEVDASNWMSALRAAREGMAERPSVPPGVSCSIDGQGVATVLDPGSRRRFLLSPGPTPATASPIPAKPAAPTPTPEAEQQRVAPHYPPPMVTPPAEEPDVRPVRGKRFETVAFMPAHLVERRIEVAGSPSSQPAPAAAAAAAPAEQAPAPAVAQPPVPAPKPAPEPAPLPAEAPLAAAAPPTTKKKFETVGFGPTATDGTAAALRGGAAIASGALDPTPRDRPAAAGTAGERASTRSSAPASSASAPVTASDPARARAELELLFERNEEPSTDNPLLYCERAYLLPRGTTVPEAEATLRWKLADLQRELEARKRGKLVNLAVFDHRWQDVPERPPVITLQWRDWRGDAVVDYPAAARLSSAPPPSGGHDDRLADVFEALGTLARLPSAADALDFAVKLLDRTVFSQAVSACLYDINTDELRFVAVTGVGAESMQGRAVPRTSGLFAQAARLEHHASVFTDLFVEPAFDPNVDSRPGLDAQTMLLRPIVFEHQLLGMLQLINRKEKSRYTAEDAHLVSYVAERLAEFVNSSRRRRSQPPRTS